MADVLLPLMMLLSRLGRAVTRPILAPLLGSALGGILHGALGSVAHLCSLLAMSLAGRYSDTHGAHSVVMVAAWLGVVSHTCLAIGAGISAPLLLVLGRIGQSVSFDAMAVPMKAIASSQKRGSSSTAGVGRLQSGTGLGFAIGSFVGGTLAQFGGTIAPMVAALACALVNLTLCWPLRHHQPVCTERRDGSRAIAAGSMVSELRQALATPSIPALLALRAMNSLSLSIALTSFEVALQDALGYQVQRIGLLLAATGLVNSAASVLVVPRLTLLMPDSSLLSAAFALLSAGRALQAVAMTTGELRTATSISMLSPFHTLCAGQLLVAVGGAMSSALIISRTAREAPDGQTGRMIGLSDTFDGIAAVAGPVCSGLLYDARGPPAPAVVASIVCLLGSALAFKTPMGQTRGSLTKED